MGFREKARDFLSLRGNLPALVVNRIVDSTGWNMLETIWQPYILGLGASMPVLGAFSSVYTALVSALQLGTGELSDSIGRKKAVVLCYSFSIIGIVIAIIAGSWAMLIPTIVLWAVADSLGDPTMPLLFAESVGEYQRGTAFSLFSLTWFLPGFYSYLIAGFLADKYGNHIILCILLVTEVASFLLFTVFVRETLKERKPVDLRRIANNFRELLRPRRGLGSFYALMILNHLSSALVAGTFVGMIWRSFDLTLTQIGALLNAFTVVAALSLLPMGKLVDRFGSRRPLILATALTCLLFTSYYLSREFLSLLLAQILRGVSVALIEPASNTYLSNAVPEAERGKFFGSLNGLKGLASFPAPIIGAFLFEVYGFQGAVLASLICSLTAAALSLRVKTLDA
jgi:MFS family permease